VRFALHGVVGTSDAPRLVGELTDLLRRHARTGLPSRRLDLACDVSGIGEPDLATVDVLAQLQLAAARLDYRLILVGASDGLRDLVDLAGLGAILPTR
jgi:hypothetical protein